MSGRDCLLHVGRVEGGLEIPQGFLATCIRICLHGLYPKDVQTYFFHEPGAIQPAMWLEQCGAMPPLLRAEGQLLKFPLSLAPKSST